MAKIFIYKEYDLIEELREAVRNKFCKSWQEEYNLLRQEIKKIIEILEKSAEVMVEDDC